MRSTACLTLHTISLSIPSGTLGAFSCLFPSFLSSIILPSTLPPNTNLSTSHLFFLPKHTEPADQDREQRLLLFGMVMKIVHLARAAPRDAPLLHPACRLTPVFCHSWVPRTWNQISGGLGGRLFYLFSLQRKANRMGIHQS